MPLVQGLLMRVSPMRFSTLCYKEGHELAKAAQECRAITIEYPFWVTSFRCQEYPTGDQGVKYSIADVDYRQIK